MRVWQGGQGPIVIALHGLGGSGRYWHRIAERDAGYTVVAPDLPGFGGSSKPIAAYDADFTAAHSTF